MYRILKQYQVKRKQFYIVGSWIDFYERIPPFVHLLLKSIIDIMGH